MAANRYQTADRGAYVYKTIDFGKTWTKVVNGIAPGDFARAIREDTVRPGLLYLGTELGFYVSLDAGSRWQPFRLNLPASPVHDIAVEENDLVIATHGRGFYVLDDIGPLRQLHSEVTQSSAWLFKPADAMRTVRRAVIDYYLASPASDLRIEVLDASGIVIRAFQSGDANQPASAADDDEGPPPPTLTAPAKKGLNRLSWNMRAAPSHDFPGLIMYQASVTGPLVPPGRYKIRLTAASTTLTADFRISRDPRLSATDADLVEQFRFGREVQDKFNQTNDTVTRIRRIKSEINDRMKRANSGDVTSPGQKLIAQLTEIEGYLYQYRNRAAKDPLNFPPQLNNKLGSLLAIVESADSRPSDSSYVVYKQLAASVDRQLSELADLLGRDLTAFDKVLATAGLPTITGI